MQSNSSHPPAQLFLLSLQYSCDIRYILLLSVLVTVVNLETVNSYFIRHILLLRYQILWRLSYEMQLIAISDMMDLYDIRYSLLLLYTKYYC